MNHTMAPAPADPQAALHASLEARLQRQRAAGTGEIPGLRSRQDTLDRLRALLREDGAALHAALSADFGNRAWPETALAELMPLAAHIRHTRAHLARWMRPRRHPVGAAFLPGRAWEERQPLGCVGIVSPWNYPLFLSVGPMIDALAAGNHVMLKPSELTPRFSALLAERLGARFPADQVATVLGGADVARAFCALPFDHLLFTGSTGVGRSVMQAAAAGLVPVTLELGGKSPAVVAPDAELERTAHSIAVGKFFNAGQTCLAPDYVLVVGDGRRRAEAFADAVVAAAARLYPTVTGNPDYTTIISERHLERLEQLVADAGAAALRRHPAHAAELTSARAGGRMVPTVLLEPARDGLAMAEEIFGPVLPVLAVPSLEDAIRFINARPRPLALYGYTTDRATERRLLQGTVSGGVTLNGTLLHCAQPSLPFGGVGASGTGAYHGETGFLRFSHRRAVYRTGRFSGFTTMTPPHGAATRRLLPWMLKL